MPPNAIYNVTITASDIVSKVSIEAPTDKYQSSSIYELNHLRGSKGFYMTFENTLNILFESDNSITKEQSKWKARFLFRVLFIRHFIHLDRMTKYLAGQTPEQIHFSFHNQR